MALFSKHTIGIDGSGNIVIQNVEGSTINVNSEGISELKSLLGEIEQQLGEEPINVLILTSNQKDIQLSLIESEILTDNLISPIKNFYHEKSLEEWKPFGEKSIVEILQNVATNLKTGILINQLHDYSSLLDLEIEALLRYIRKDSILIIDSLSLLDSKNLQVAEIFDDYHVGGCILVDSFCFNSTEQKLLEARKKITKFLEIYLKNKTFIGKINNDHIKIEDVNAEYKLINALISLAEKVGGKVKKTIAGLDTVKKLI